MIRFFLNTVPLLAIGFYVGMSLDRWLDPETVSSVDNLFISMETWTTDTVMVAVDWVKAKFQSS
jgi:hypothetical protein